MYPNLQKLFETVQDTDDSTLALALYLGLPEYDLPDDAKEDITADELTKSLNFITHAQYLIDTRHLAVTSPDEGSQYDYPQQDFIANQEVNGTVYDIIKGEMHDEENEIDSIIPKVDDRYLLKECLAHLTRCHSLLDEVWQSQNVIYWDANNFFTMLDQLDDKELDDIVSNNA